MSSGASPAESAGPARVRRALAGFWARLPERPWIVVGLALAAGAMLLTAGLPLLSARLQVPAGHAAMGMAALSASAACLGARRVAAPAGRATWLLLALGGFLAASGQAIGLQDVVGGPRGAFPSVDFHFMVAFHVAFAAASLLALRPAHQARFAAEISLDGFLVLLAVSTLVLRLGLDEALGQGLITLPQVVATLVGEVAVTASLFFTALLLLWRDTALPRGVAHGLLVAAICFAVADLRTIFMLDPRYDVVTSGLDLSRLAGWLILLGMAYLAVARPEGVLPASGREVASRRFRQLIIPGAALFLAAWSVDAARRGGVTPPSQVVIGLMGVVLAARIGTALYAVEQESAERRRAEAQAARARLRAVTAQMNPHFLFNALHSLSALVRRDARATERALERLGGLLRYGLDSGEELVRLEDEWRFARDFLEMEALRLGPRLTVKTDIGPAALDVLVPPFVLQPLVENATRHGVSPFPQGGTVEIRAALRGDVLVLEVADSGPGAGSATVLGGAGVGIRGVRAQLEAHYGHEARLETEQIPGGGFVVRLVIPAELE